MKMTHESPMPFGRHKGKRLEDVPANYLLWLGSVLKPGDAVRTSLLLYIAENQASLEHTLHKRLGTRDQID